jgi:rhodanese-related sulfurtransferase
MTDQPQSNRAARPNRRIVVWGGVAIATVAAVYSLSSMVAPATELSLTPDEAHQHATAQEILLIDIRRPDEWDLTGIGQGAVPLDMRRDDFTSALRELAGDDLGRPIALICARGVRSRRQSAQMIEAGFTQIIDIPEGMLGSGSGPGWLARGLPIYLFES